MVRDQVTQMGGLIVLFVIAGMAVAGPGGVLAWSENRQRLDAQQQEILTLQKQRSALQNRVRLLDPKDADRDLVGELLHRDLNVAHPDDIVIQRPR